MVMAERRDEMVDYINEEGSVTFAQLKSRFPDVSDMTLRTDLKTLDKDHLIIRVHGGARSVSYALGTDDLLSRRASRRSGEKSLIATKAAELIVPGHTIFLDSGSSTTALASIMNDMDLMVFTNSITVASELARLERPICHLLGGRLNRYSLSTKGSQAIESARRLSFDQVFLGVAGYQPEEGFSCGDDDEAVFKRVLIERSRESTVLMDSSKEGMHATFRVCALSDVSTVITDDDASDEFRQACVDASVRLL